MYFFRLVSFDLRLSLILMIATLVRRSFMTLAGRLFICLLLQQAQVRRSLVGSCMRGGAPFYSIVDDFFLIRRGIL